MRVLATRHGIVVDCIGSVVDVGQLAALSTKLGGMLAHVEPTEREDGQRLGAHQVRFVRDEDDWGVSALANAAMIQAYADGLSGDQLLERLRQQLVERGFPMDQPLQDVYGVGEAGRNLD